ncbi:hypothetical protein KYB31_15630 [Clostridium felsineum]|uniref:hypothetical protein n=1 Tax=Clostridium felsineum TaxID=36839 RepID=UPI00214DBF58|nr:hypothetical protein [Clostridium felsineum]MCR3760408.1 hypothetical protein [Clostridium felsineum]
MPLTKNVEKKIWDVEGFDVRIKHNGSDVRGDKNGLPQYDKVNAAKNIMTVGTWKAKRFSIKYPGYDVEVLNSDGSVASGQTQLGTVRDTYNDSDNE